MKTDSRAGTISVTVCCAVRHARHTFEIVKVNIPLCSKATRHVMTATLNVI
jgi:hypothetical protein